MTVDGEPHLTSNGHTPVHLEEELDRLRRRVAELEQIVAQGQQESRFSHFFRRTLDMLCIVGLDGRFKELNPLWEKTLGYPLAEMVDQPFIEFVHPDDKPATLEVAGRISDTNTDIITFENRYLCKDGSYRSLMWTSTMANGMIYATARDVTEQRKLEAALRDQTTLLRLILEEMSDGVIATDGKGDFPVFNAAAMRMFGSGQTDEGADAWAATYGNYLPDMVTPFPTADLPMVRALHGETTANIEMFVRHAAAPEGLWALINGYPLRDPGGAVKYGVVVCRDITAQKRSEEIMRIYAETVKHMPTGMIVLHLEQADDPATLRLIAANARAQEFTGVELEAEVGRLFGEIFPDALTSGPAAIYAEVVRTGQSRDLGEARFKDDRVGERVFSIKAFPLPNQRVSVVFENITERKQAEAHMGRLAAIIETTTDYVGMADAQGLTRYINPAGRRLLGIGADEPVEGIPVGEFSAERVRPALVEQVMPAVLRDGFWSGETLLLHRNGSEIPVSQVIIVHKTPDGEIDVLSTIIRDITAQKRAEEALRQSIAQEETIRAQQAALAELSTPLIPLSERVVVMPLIGSVDSRRAQMVMDTLLQGIAASHADVAILDITGVSVVDTQVANVFVRAAQAVKLLGAQVMITGIRPEVAQTLIGLGVDLSGIITRGSLQSGIALAMKR